MEKQDILNSLDIKAFFSSELPSIKWNSSEGIALCPFHDDHRKSLSVNKETGLFFCHACNEKGDMFSFYRKKHGVNFQTTINALAREAGLTTEPQKKIVKTYDYTDESGNLLFQTVRFKPKDFKQRRPDGKDKWIWNLEGVRSVVYNLPEIIKTKSIIIPEGEKDCDNLKAIGLTATCNPMGAGKWKPEYNQYFKDKRVVIIPDNDDAGHRHALQVARNLKEITESLRILELSGLKEKGDVTDWMEIQKAKGKDAEAIKNELLSIIKATPEWIPEEPKEDTLSFLKKGAELINLECTVEWIIDKLIPKQSITLLHGKGGIGKTWISLILGDAVSKSIPFMGLPSQQQPVVFIDFENSLPVLVERVKKIGASEVLFWHNTNEIRPPKLDKEEWTQYKSLPIGLIIYDTLRASQGKDENSSQDMALIMSRLKELRDAGFTIILLHHTPKSNDRTYKGSTAIMDLADHVLSLHRVRKGSLDEIDDDEEGYYRLGTKEKTRYEPFHIFLDFDPEKGFVVAPDPDEEDMKEIHSLIIELKETKGELPIQSKVTEKVKEELELSKSKIVRLLRRGEGKYWNSHKIPERKNAKVFEPISVFQFSNTIYNQKTEKLPDSVNPLSSNNLSINTPKSLDNTEFASFSEGTQKTEKQEIIDLEHEEVEIIK